MTRKDYVMLAAALHRALPDRFSEEPARVQFVTDCTNVATALANDNPRFDKARFLKACGVSC